MERRAFVRSLACVPVGLLFQSLIGSGGAPGGVFEPIPINFTDYLTFYPPVSPMNSAHDPIVRALGYVGWAPLGSSQGLIQLYAGTAPDGPHAQERIVDHMRRTWLEDEHYPGWLCVLHSRMSGIDSEGDAIFRNERIWTRVGYVRWMKPCELQSPFFTVVN